MSRASKPFTLTGLRQVDRRDRLSVREFRREYLYRNRPVVITNVIEQWKARSLWTLDFFRAHYGATSVTLSRYEGAHYRVRAVETASLRSFIDAVEGNDFTTYPYYVRDDWRIFVSHKELLEDYAVPEYFFDWYAFVPSFMKLVYPRIFIGPRGAITPLHMDIWETHAWLAQLVGRKRWLLFPPDQRPLLYDYQVQPCQADLEKFPLFRKASPLECTIGPGDVIFVPSGWAHEVISLDATISITHNYLGPGCFRPGLTRCIKEKFIDRLTHAIQS